MSIKREDLYNAKALTMICPLYNKQYADSPAEPCCNTCKYYHYCIFIEIYLKLANQ